MKTKKIYWRLAFVLSLIPAIVWTIVWLINGAVPKGPLDKLWIDLKNVLPLWSMTRWWDILGVFLSVMTIHNISLRKIWDVEPRGVLQFILYGLVVVIGVTGCVLTLCMILETNLFIADIVFAADVVIMTIILYLAQQIPDNVSERFKKWIMQNN